jgi:hypothetical protein
VKPRCNRILSSATLVALTCGMSALASADCGFWKGLACAIPISTCATTAGLGGREPLLKCLNVGASYCDECVGAPDPRDSNPHANAPGVVCDANGCKPGVIDQGLESAPAPAAPGPWKIEDLNVASQGIPSIVADSAQSVLFYKGPNGHLWMSTHANNGPWWSGASDLGGIVLQSAPSAIAPTDHVYRVFYRGTNSHLWMSSWDGGPWWSAPTDLGGVSLTSAPSAVALASNRYRVFYKGPNGHLWMSSWDGGPWWSAPADLGGVVLRSSPAAVAVLREPSHMAVFYVGANAHLTASIFGGGPWWSAPIDLGGVAIKGDLGAASPAPHEIDVYYTSTSGELHQSQWTGGPWWSAPFARSVSTVDGGSSVDGRSVYVRGINGHLSVTHP